MRLLRLHFLELVALEELAFERSRVRAKMGRRVWTVSDLPQSLTLVCV